MIKGITKTGFQFELSESVIDDMELIEAIAESDSLDPFAQMRGYSALISKILGNNKKALYEHVRNDEGRVPPESIKNELLDIFAAFGDTGKKSLHSEE